MEEKEYKRNFINNFIVSLFFESKLDEENCNNIVNLLNDSFPINEKINIKKSNGNSESILTNSENKTRNILYNVERTERITISSDSILIETLKYNSFNKVKSTLEKIILVLKNNYKISKYSRIGMRYINLIQQPIKERKDIFDWNEYISSSLLLNNCFIENKFISQEIQTIDFKITEEIFCRLQYGIPNRNMPADLMEKKFLIDIECYTNAMVEQDNISETLDIIHKKCIEVFEKSIDDKLRREMYE